MTDNINKDSVQPEPARSVPVDAEAVVTPEAITPETTTAETAADGSRRPRGPAPRGARCRAPAAPADARRACRARRRGTRRPCSGRRWHRRAADRSRSPRRVAPAAAAHRLRTDTAAAALREPAGSAAQLPYGQHPAQPYGAQHTQPTVPIPGAAFGVGGPAGPTPPHGARQPAASAAPKRNGVGMLVAALAIGALVGGGSAAGVMAIAGAQNQGTPSSVSSPAERRRQQHRLRHRDHRRRRQGVPERRDDLGRRRAGAGTGSGVVLIEDGYVLTNTHVVTLDGETGHPQIQVTMSDGNAVRREHRRHRPDLRPRRDQARRTPSGLTPLEFADSSKLNVGDTAIAIGAPLGLSGTVTNGIVSALNRSITVASSAVPETPAG